MHGRTIIFKSIGKLLLHIGFWCGVLLFYTYFFGYGSSDMNYVFSFSIFLMPITIGLCYILIYKLIPEYFLTKQYLKFILYTIYAIIISSYLIIVSIFFGLIYLSDFKVSDMAPISRNIGFVMIGVYLVVFVASTFKLLKMNYKATLDAQKLEAKILETQFQLKEQELNYLKMQIHPHFLFNTLNTLYGFALKKSDETPEMILKLSGLLDYLLYQTTMKSVRLRHEIDHIKNYMQLEKMRHDKTLQIFFNSSEIKNDYNIAPMILLPFVENAFKHSVILNNQRTIHLEINMINNQFKFIVTNSINKKKINGDGIGLVNIKKRLDILYSDNYVLNFSETEHKFIVELILKKEIE